MTDSFYKTGGTLARNAPSYILRRADEELFQAILAGEFCYILDSRQVGKSSLVAHTKRRLEEAGVAVAAVELTALGITSNTPEQWYDALLAKLGEQLPGPFLRPSPARDPAGDAPARHGRKIDVL